MMRRAMALQNLIIAVCFVTVLFNSMANGRPLHMGTSKRQTETRENTILQQIISKSHHIFTNSEHSGNEARRYQLIPVNDTELLSVLTEMPLELDQLGVLCDVMAMEESVKLLSDSEAYHINTIISEKIFPGKTLTITKELCLTYRLSEYKRENDPKKSAEFLNLFNQVDTLLYNSPPVNRNPEIYNTD